MLDGGSVDLNVLMVLSKCICKEDVVPTLPCAGYPCISLCTHLPYKNVVW